MLQEQSCRKELRRIRRYLASILVVIIVLTLVVIETRVSLTPYSSQTGLREATSRYASLNTLMDQEGEIVGSGVRIDSKHIISCAHLHGNPTDPKPLFHLGERLTTKATWQVKNTFDITLLTMNTSEDFPPVVVARNVDVGDELVGISNANERDGFYRFYRVAKVAHTWIEMDRPVIGGESGSALFNRRTGELVSIVRRTNFVGSDKYHVGYGQACSPDVIRTLLTRNDVFFKSRMRINWSFLFSTPPFFNRFLQELPKKLVEIQDCF